MGYTVRRQPVAQGQQSAVIVPKMRTDCSRFPPSQVSADRPPRLLVHIQFCAALDHLFHLALSLVNH